MTPDAALRHLASLETTGIKFGLANTEQALAAMGKPHQGGAFVHVGGTNGKGSVCALLAGVLSRHGLRCGLYTSPHLSDVRERIQIGGSPLAASRLGPLVARVRRAAEGIPLTYFEFLTVMALAAFAEAKVDVAVLEVGMGGRLDATNVVRPLVSVITNVSREHTRYLGRTVKEIAAEKAGIVKPGVPLVTAAQGAALEVIEERCRQLGAPLYRLRGELRLRRRGEGFDYLGLKMRLPNLQVALPGRHQQVNAALALAAAELALGSLGRQPRGEAVRAALADVSWPGRLERLAESPLLLVDGAHNPAGARALARYLAEMRRGRLILVVGLLRDKDAAGFLKPLLPLAWRVVACEPASPRALEAAELARLMARHFPPGAQVAASVVEALRLAQSLAAPTDTICVCGSLYTVGEAREQLRRARKRAAC